MSRAASTPDTSRTAYIDWIITHPQFNDLGINPADVEQMDQAGILEVMSHLPPTINIDFLIDQIADVNESWRLDLGRLRSTLPPIR